MRNLIATLLIVVFAGCAHSPETDGPESTDFVIDLRRDIPIRAGMTVEQVKGFVAANNQKVRALDSDATDNPEPPSYSRRELHLYVFSELNNDSTFDGPSLTYLWSTGDTSSGWTWPSRTEGSRISTLQLET